MRQAYSTGKINQIARRDENHRQTESAFSLSRDSHRNAVQIWSETYSTRTVRQGRAKTDTKPVDLEALRGMRMIEPQKEPAGNTGGILEPGPICARTDRPCSTQQVAERPLLHW